MADETKPSAGLNDETIVSQTPPPEPQRIGSFTVLGKLGEGGMGAVYKAHDPAIDRDVALKLLPPHLSTDADFVARFKREAAAAGKFVHPNIVQVYAAGEDAGTHFIAMEFVEGVSLQKHITNTGKLDSAEALAITVKAAEALQYAWNKAKLVHRDIKPDNILISNDGDVKVADLGLAKTLQSGSTNFTQTGTVMGSPHYISPEQGRGDKDVDFRSDIYSLGCTLFHMLTGRPPFEGDNIGTLIHKHIYEPPPDIATLCPDCPERVASLVKKMMAKDREKRFASYDELIAEMTAAHDSLGKSVTAGAAAKRRKLMMLAGAGVAVVAVVAGVLVWAPWKSPVGRAVPSAPPPSPSNVTRPVDDAFIKEVAALPAEEQVKRVVAKLKELNPGYDGEESHRIQGGKVIHFDATGSARKFITDVTPIRAFAALKSLQIGGVTGCKLEDLSPLRGMQLEELHLWGQSRLSNLRPIQGMPMTKFLCACTSVTDLSPLKGMRLTSLQTQTTGVSDLTPLKGMPLEELWCFKTKITDLSPLLGMPLKILRCDFKTERDTAILRSIKTLETINGVTVKEFWQRVAAGDIPQPK